MNVLITIFLGWAILNLFLKNIIGDILRVNKNLSLISFQEIQK